MKIKLLILTVIAAIALLSVGQSIADLAKKYNCKQWILWSEIVDGDEATRKETLAWCVTEDGEEIRDKTE